MQTVTPYVLYRDVAAAIEWLGRTFGFEEKLRFTDEDGTVTHAELTLGDGEVFLGHPGPDYRSPQELGAYTHLVHVYVADVDAHYGQAVKPAPDPRRAARHSLRRPPVRHRGSRGATLVVREAAPGGRARGVGSDRPG